MTSGTTGLPKSIGYTHRKYLDSVRLISQAIDFSRPSGTQDVNMLGMPLTGPGSGLVLPTLLSGSALLMPENFHAETLARLIARHRVTRAFCRPRPSSTCWTTPIWRGTTCPRCAMCPMARR
jgi:fatty-acyl-CoA synthase